MCVSVLAMRSVVAGVGERRAREGQCEARQWGAAGAGDARLDRDRTKSALGSDRPRPVA
jgi:hypothetical protein